MKPDIQEKQNHLTGALTETYRSCYCTLRYFKDQPEPVTIHHNTTETKTTTKLAVYLVVVYLVVKQSVIQ